MATRMSAASLARYDQVAAVVRGANGFPLATGEVGRRTGWRLAHVGHQEVPPQLAVRPECWPEHVDRADAGYVLTCARCDDRHAPPVWREYDGMAVRPALVRLERQGLVRRFQIDGHRSHYWQWIGGPDDDPA